MTVYGFRIFQKELTADEGHFEKCTIRTGEVKKKKKLLNIRASKPTDYLASRRLGSLSKKRAR